MRSDIEIISHGVHLSAWHYEAETDDLTTPRGRPCVVMAHGLGGTKDSGLEPYAERARRLTVRDAVVDQPERLANQRVLQAVGEEPGIHDRRLGCDHDVLGVHDVAATVQALRVLTEDAQLSMKETSLGLVPDLTLLVSDEAANTNTTDLASKIVDNTAPSGSLASPLEQDQPPK